MCYAVAGHKLKSIASVVPVHTPHPWYTHDLVPIYISSPFAASFPTTELSAIEYTVYFIFIGVATQQIVNE
jgi:hypothetical protein